MPLVLKLKKNPAPKILRFGNRAQKRIEAAPAIVGVSNALDEFIGKAVFFASDGVRVAGKAKRVDGKNLIVQLAVPNREGILCVTETELSVKADDLEITRALLSEKLVRHFEAGADVKLAEDKKFVPVYDVEPGADGEKPTKRICDYQDVVIEGYASTFMSTTPSDRGGDYIMPGAFDNTLTEFRKNPVILCDHDNECCKLAGSWSKIGTTTTGLAVRGNISNAPGMQDVRFKLVEGHLKGLSIGGIWYYAHDGRGIEEADLFEISLVPVPMNPDALAFTRSLGVADCTKAFSRFWRKHATLKTE